MKLPRAVNVTNCIGLKFLWHFWWA